MHAPLHKTPTLVIRGMYGMGDCLHQRAPLRELLDAGHRVVLDTFYWSMYHDLVERGLQLRLIGGIMPRIRDAKQATLLRDRIVAGPQTRMRLSYSGETVLRHGSILAAQYASIGMRMPKRPDFSLPVPDAWREGALAALDLDRVGSKPLMVYRPSTLNNVWLSRARAPDPQAYKTLYEAIRDSFYVVAVANLGDKGEHIDGPVMPCDLDLTHGELAFESLAGMFSLARLAFTCPGFSPVLAQAVGTPVVITYGGNESFKTTNSVGAHLAPTLALEPIRPCACHKKEHDCDKSMDLPLQIHRLREFALRCAA
jgi:hypothetical protein